METYQYYSDHILTTVNATPQVIATTQYTDRKFITIKAHLSLIGTTVVGTYCIRGVFTCSGGTLTQHGTIEKTSLGNTGATDVNLSVSENSLLYNVTGIDSESVDWKIVIGSCWL
uniref:Uncharacterized protein n=1 Tax=viral metagenome TaxID=1070528 RepID=A0A6C0BRC6_9ZZZZ